MVPLTIDPRTITEADFPATGTPAQQWCFLINYALLAPSEYNTQPWRFRVHESSVDLCADYSRRLPVVDPEDRELLISCGAACFNLHLAARHFGYRVHLEYCALDDRPELLARLHLETKEQVTSEEDRLFAAIARRHSNRSCYQDRGVPEAVLDILQALARKERTWLQLVQEPQARRAIADLIVAGDRRQWVDRRFRYELAEWVHPRASGDGDGLPAAVHAKGSFQEISSSFVVRTFDLWRAEATKDRQLVAGAPVLAVLGTFADTPTDWFAAGLAIERILLEVCASGLQSSFVNQPMEVVSLRGWLKQALECSDFPQLVLRIGYGTPAPFTPRRCVQDVLVEAHP